MIGCQGCHTGEETEAHREQTHAAGCPICSGKLRREGHGRGLSPSRVPAGLQRGTRLKVRPPYIPTAASLASSFPCEPNKGVLERGGKVEKGVAL